MMGMAVNRLVGMGLKITNQFPNYSISSYLKNCTILKNNCNCTLSAYMNPVLVQCGCRGQSLCKVFNVLYDKLNAA